MYFMFLSTIHASLARCVEKITRDFLWPNNESTKSLHWVNWGGVFHPQQEEGQGISPLT